MTRYELSAGEARELLDKPASGYQIAVERLAERLVDSRNDVSHP